jgi:hypothetical protein
MGFKSNSSKSPNVSSDGFAKMFTNKGVVTALVVLVIVVVFTGLFVNMRHNLERFADDDLSIKFVNDFKEEIFVKTGVDNYRIPGNNKQRINICKNGNCYIHVYNSEAAVGNKDNVLDVMNVGKNWKDTTVITFTANKKLQKM